MGSKLITLLVKPNSKKIFVNPLDSETYEIAISSKPEKGKANREIVEVLAKFLKIKKTQITILKGHKSQKKIIQITDL